MGVEAERKALRDKLTDAECRLKGFESPLEKAREEADGERATVASLRMSLDEVKSQQESVKEKAANEVITTYLKSEAFNDETTEYFISGFETLHRRALRIYPILNLSMLRADANSLSTEELIEEVAADQEKDDATS